jgi:hypothetical protein
MSTLDKAAICQLCGEAGKVKRAFLEKQRRTAEVLGREFAIESYDRMLDGGACSRRRPDFVIDGAYHKIVVEVDEYQHRRGLAYGPDCEVRRMWDIAQALGMPTVFVRYNPDPYRTPDGQHADPALAAREAALISWVKTLQGREPSGSSFATAIYLYYDGFTRPEDATEEGLPDPYAEYRRDVAPIDVALTDAALTDAALTDADIDELLADLGL